MRKSTKTAKVAGRRSAGRRLADTQLEASAFIVKGQIRLRSGEAVIGATVTAFAKNPDGDQMLSADTTDEEGRYGLRYASAHRRQAEDQGPDVIVRVYAEGKVLGESEVIKNSPPNVTIDLLIQPDTISNRSEYEQLRADLLPLLDDVPLAELTGDRITSLASELKIDKARIKALVGAARLSPQLNVPMDLLYGLGRQGVSLELDKVIEQSDETLSAGHQRSIEGNIIPSTEAASLQGMREILERLRSDRTPLHDLATTLNLHLSPGLKNALDKAGVRTLEDLRTKGGAALGDGLRSAVDQRQAQKLKAHAQLSILSAEPRLRAQLIEKGFVDAVTIAETPPGEFAERVAGKLDESEAGRVHLQAVAQTRFLDNWMAEALAARATGYATEQKATTNGGSRVKSTKKPGGRGREATTNGAPPGRVFRITNPIIGSLSPLKCGCKDCEAAVSPAAYLADLLDYALNRVRYDGAAIKLDFLTETFHQPFGTQPASCESVEQQVRQVRLCVEVLRSYLRSKWSSLTQAVKQGLASAEVGYARQAYTDLLTRLGTSYDEIRLARTATPEARQELAGRLGIGLGTATPDHLEQLYLEPQQTNEERIEELFGLADTTRDPLSVGVKLGDGQGQQAQLVRWNLEGVEWGGNTDADGFVYLRLSKSGTTHQVDVYRDSARTQLQLVASGTRDTPEGEVQLTPMIIPPLSGSVTIAYQADNATIKLSVVPRFLAWRLEYLRRIWEQQDWPVARLDAGWPLIDPDVIGPDDLRHPVKKAAAADPDGPFDLWLRRREWVDSRLQDLRALTPNLAGMLSSMAQSVAYETVNLAPWPGATTVADLEKIYDDLGQGIDVMSATAKIESDLNLTVESFTQLMRLRAKHQDAGQFAGAEPLTYGEWREIHSILTQAWKTKLFSTWEEEEEELTFGPKEFWISLREPKEGDWPPVVPPQTPLIDPDIVKLEDLPDSAVGKRARELWNQRQDALATLRKNLRTARETQGFQAMLKLAFLGDTTAPGPLPHDLSQLLGDLNSADPAVAQSATLKITGDLHLSVDAFRRLMAVRAKDAAAVADPQKPKPTVAEWTDVYTSLTTANKELKSYPAWILAEQNATTGVRYWTALKATLPRWRATPETRQQWQQDLRVSSGAPLIDPDLVGPGDLKSPTAGGAFTTWKARDTWVTDTLALLKAAPATLAGLNTLLQQTLGVAGSGLTDLALLYAGGMDIRGRLEQLTLSSPAFERLLRIREMLVAGALPANAPKDGPEWTDVYSILLQVLKRREFADWREEEQARHLTLSPDHFQLPTPDPSIFPVAGDPEPPAWRGTIAARREWRDELQSRIDQQKAVAQALRDTVSAAEDATLPDLRDALLLATDAGASFAPASQLEARAKWCTDTLLIDAKMDGCQLTTRVAQAIETLQNMFFSIRTGQLADSHPKLTLKDENFDEEWQWMGSYGTWRAAVFVFLYPENILLPTLRRDQTPTFRRLVSELRSIRHLTPKRAREAADAYALYLRDVCSLEPQAHADISVDTPNGPRTLRYMFGRGGETGTIYWRRWGAVGLGLRTNIFWDPVPGLAGDLTIFGTAIYRPSSTTRILYLVLSLNKPTKQELLCLRYSLEREQWMDPVSLSLPDRVTTFTLAVEKRGDEKDAIILTLAVPDGILYRRALDQEGRDWAEGDWKPMDRLWAKWQHHNVGTTKLVPGSHLGTVLRDPSIDFFATNTAGEIVRILWNGFLLNNQFRPTEVISGLKAPAGAPVTGVFRNLSTTTQEDIFVVDPTGYTYTNRFDLLTGWQSQWTKIVYTHVSPGYVSFESTVTKPGYRIAALSRNAGGANIFVVSSNSLGSVNTAWFQGSTAWSEWEAEGDLITSLRSGGTVVTAVTTANTRIHLFAVNPDGEVEHQRWAHPLGWLPASAIPGSPTLPVTAVVAAVGRSTSDVDLFVTDDQGTVRTARWSDPTGWGKWRSVGDGSMIFPAGAWLAAQSRSPTHLVVFAMNKDGAIYSAWQDDQLNEGKWYPWFPVGDPAKDIFPPQSKIAAVTSYPQIGFHAADMKLFVIGADGDIHWTEAEEYIAVSPVQPLYESVPPTPGPNAILIQDRMTESQRSQRSAEMAVAFDGAYATTWAELDILHTYLEEAFYFVPVHLALQLQRSGEYVAALDWFRTVYDYTAQSSKRKIYSKLIKEEGPAPDTYQHADNWLLDPLNPHLIAKTRSNTYTRFTLLSIVRCLLDFADAEFTQDSPESVARARILYLTALELLDTAELKTAPGICQDVIGNLNIHLADAYSVLVTEAQWIPIINQLRTELARIESPEKLSAVVEEVKEVLVADGPIERRIGRARELIAAVAAGDSDSATIGTVVSEGRQMRAQAYTAALMDPAIADTTWRVAKGAAENYLNEAEIPSAVSEAGSKGTYRALGRPGGTLLAGAGRGKGRYIPPVYRHVPAISPLFCIPVNPVLKALRLHAELNLYKLRHCRNIGGMERELEPYAAPTDTTSGLPAIGAGGQIVLPGAVTLRPTPYRYSFLIERAKQLAAMAQQIEASFLSVLEKRDLEAHNLLKARQDMALSRAGVTLQDLRTREAEGGVKLADLQQQRAQVQLDTYQEWIDAGHTTWEQDLLEAYSTIGTARQIASGVDTLIQATTLAAQFAIVPGLAAAMFAAAGARGIANLVSIGAETQAQIAAFQASHERRKQEWEFQKALAQQDLRIGAQQVNLAEDHVRVVGQERTIARMQADNAEVIIDFLATKFTSLELYDWMSGVLEKVYSFFLQQATAVAQLSGHQLAFERQEVPPPFIQADYWEAPSDGAATDGAGGRAPDRRGLTGSARLLQDIYQLDQYAIDTNRRKLQLTKTISLARLAPLEFQQFRETGVLTFATPLDLFDRDFPGHYLRLIKRVRTSVIALIPPAEGIRATLASSGFSRVILGGDIFQTVVIRRAPESVALTSPFNASGLFELEQQSEMLLPFEGTGLHTTWEFRMPRPANPINYQTLADVLVTLEYTALDSFDYRQQVIQLFKPTVSSDRAFSLRHQFADAWYDLNNPDQTATPMVVRFSTKAQDFPASVADLKIEHVVLYFARAKGQTFEVPVTLRFTGSEGGPVGGGARSVDGIISTRRSNAGSWTAIRGSPFGEWELALPNTTEVKEHFKQGDIEDILFVLTYSGTTADWPA